MRSVGAELENLCGTAQQELLFVAPFIKLGALERLLSIVSDNVRIQCITRWRPEEIAVGVSDIEVWDLLNSRENSTLWLRPDLHAKYYRADNQCLVGSANITATALGWRSNPNFELLIPSPADNPLLIQFEQELLPGCIQVDESLYQQVKTAVDTLKIEKPPKQQIEETSLLEDAEAEDVPLEAWLPTLRHPENLYKAYAGTIDELSTGSRITATQDLQALSIPPELSQKSFDAYVGTVLLQMPIIHKVDQFVVTPQRFGAVRDLLKEQPCADTPDFDANRAWQTLMRWLLYFLPNRYQMDRPRHSEIFSRINEIDIE